MGKNKLLRHQANGEICYWHMTACVLTANPACCNTKLR